MRVMALLLLVGCKIETDISAGDRDDTVPNPPELVNPIQVDRVVQRSQPEVDVLFVVDNSGSMEEEQTALAQNFPSFMTWFTTSGLDYHIGVTSTDTSGSEAGKLRVVGETRFIDPETPDPASVFGEMAMMGINGDSEEKGRDAAFTLLETNRGIPRNVDFYREEASLHIVFVSDEEDSSRPNPISRPEFREWMDTVKATPDLVTAHAITWIPGESCPDGWSPGVDYVAYANWTGGAMLNICEADWEPFMTALGLQSSGLKREFFLSRLPTTDPMTIEVENITVDEGGEEVTRVFEVCMAPDLCEVEYVPSRNSIVFIDHVPDPLSEVVVTYAVRELYEDDQSDVF